LLFFSSRVAPHESFGDQTQLRDDALLTGGEQAERSRVLSATVWLDVRVEPAGVAATSSRGTRKKRTNMLSDDLWAWVGAAEVWSARSSDRQARPPARAPASLLTTRERDGPVGSQSLLVQSGHVISGRAG
jgi:hypothetical protein